MVFHGVFSTTRHFPFRYQAMDITSESFCFTISTHEVSPLIDGTSIDPNSYCNCFMSETMTMTMTMTKRFGGRRTMTRTTTQPLGVSVHRCEKGGWISFSSSWSPCQPSHWIRQKIDDLQALLKVLVVKKELFVDFCCVDRSRALEVSKCRCASLNVLLSSKLTWTLI